MIFWSSPSKRSANGKSPTGRPPALAVSMVTFFTDPMPQRGCSDKWLPAVAIFPLITCPGKPLSTVLCLQYRPPVERICVVNCLLSCSLTTQITEMLPSKGTPCVSSLVMNTIGVIAGSCLWYLSRSGLIDASESPEQTAGRTLPLTQLFWKT